MEDSQKQKFLEIVEDRKATVEALRRSCFELKELLFSLYPDNAHFLYELLQNAEDAGAREVQFKLEKNGLQFVHNGRDFDINDIDAITRVGASNKKNDLNTIGRFGVGFKAVFAYTETPRIDSGPFSFSIHDLFRLELEDENPKRSNETRFYFPFDKPEKNSDQSFNEIERGLACFSDATILFLKNIGVIRWEVEGGPSGKISVSEREFICRITREITLPNGNKDETLTDWLRLQKKVSGLPKEEVASDLKIGIAFKLTSRNDEHTSSLYDIETNETKRLGDFWHVIPCKKANLCIYFPAEKESTNLLFHINAPFASTIGRDSIPHENRDNCDLRDQLVQLLIDSLPKLRDEKFLNDENFLAALPQSSQESSEYDLLNDFYVPFVDGLKKAFSENALLLTNGGEFRSSEELYLGTREFYKVLSDEDLRIIVDNPKACWVKPMFNRRAISFLEHVANVNKWEKEQLACAIRSYYGNNNSANVHLFLQHNLAWLKQFYALIATCPNAKSSMLFCQFILGKDGNLHCPRNIYMPEEDMQDYDFQVPLIDGRLIDDREMREVFSALGVEEADQEKNQRAIVQSILEKYYDTSSVAVPEQQHLEHMKRFLAYRKLYSNDLFQNRSFFRACVPGQAYEKGTFKKAKDLFLDISSEEVPLRLVLHSSHRPSLLWSGYPADICDFAKELGAKSKLAIEKIDTVKFNRHLKQYITHGSTACQFDFRLPESILPRGEVDKMLMIAGTDRFNPSLPDECEWDLTKARHVWDMMCSDWSSSFSKAQYRKSNPCINDSLLVQFMREFSWVPDKQGIFRKPCDLDENNLHKDFRLPVSPKEDEWLGSINFGASSTQGNNDEARIREKAEEIIQQQTGFSLSDLRKFNEAQITREDIESLIEKKLSQQSFTPPSSIAPNPERRKIKSTEAAEEAPEKEYSIRERSVRVNQSLNRLDVRGYLNDNYQNENDEPVCQLCWTPLSTCSFKTSGGEYYFEGIACLKNLKKEHRSNALLLCPLCAAKYKELIQRNESYMNNIRSQLLKVAAETVSEEDLVLDIHLNGYKEKLHFVQRHWIDLQAAIQVEENRIFE